jgi:hypothetical protein
LGLRTGRTWERAFKVATIIRDPLVADHIIELGIESDAACAEVRRHYEEGNLVLLRGARFDLDFGFLSSLNFDVEGPPEIMRKLKKYGGERILTLDPSSSGALDQFVFRTIFAGDTGKLAHFQDQVRSGDAQSDAFYAKLFPNYVNTRAVYTWRFTSTKFENLHWDNFGIPEPFQQVRIFTNIASSPRLWRTSHRIEDFAASIYRDAKLNQFAGKIGDELNYFINNSVLGGMNTPCLDRLPKHHIAFEQGDVWLCETRIVAHQIYHGEKAFAAMYFSEPESMDRPELAFDARIARLHESHGSAAAFESTSAATR